VFFSQATFRKKCCQYGVSQSFIFSQYYS